METKNSGKDPELGLDFGTIKDMPVWFNDRGGRMNKLELAEHDHILRISSEWAKLEIVPDLLELGDDNLPTSYFIAWNIVHERVGNLHTSGRIRLTKEQIESAFSLTDEHEVFLVSNFIRVGNFLKIPTAGTSDKRDPNICVYIKEETKMAVAKLLKSEKPFSWTASTFFELNSAQLEKTAIKLLFFGAPGKIRTSEDRSQQIYSLPSLTT